MALHKWRPTHTARFPPPYLSMVLLFSHSGHSQGLTNNTHWNKNVQLKYVLLPPYKLKKHAPSRCWSRHTTHMVQQAMGLELRARRLSPSCLPPRVLVTCRKAHKVFQHAMHHVVCCWKASKRRSNLFGILISFSSMGTDTHSYLHILLVKLPHRLEKTIIQRRVRANNQPP